MGLNLLNNIKEELSDIAQVDQDPSLEGRQLLMVLSPLKKNNLEILGYKLKTHTELLRDLRKLVLQ